MSDEKTKTKKNHKPLIQGLSSGFILCLVMTTALWFTPALHSYLLIAVITCLVLSTVLGLIVFWISQKNQHKTDEESNKSKALVTHRCMLLKKHFFSMLKVQKNNKRLQSRYDLPVYLWYSDAPTQDKGVITQMGYEAYRLDEFGNDIEFPILFWLSEHSILISISQGDDQHPDYIKTLIKCLMTWRPRQAINGLLLATNAELLLGQKALIKQRSDQLKSDCTKLNRLLGLSVPTYVVVTQSGAVSDFCQYFSGFDDARREEAFGAMMPYRKHGGIDADWYNFAYDSLIGQLTANMTNALSGQLNLDYRKSIASAPFQFGLLKQNFWLMLNRLYGLNQLGEGLMFRGFFFTHDASHDEETDILAATISNDLGNEYYHPKESQAIQQVLFSQHLMTHVLLPEQLLVGVNRKKENWLLTLQAGYTLACLGLLLTTLTIIKLDFDFQSHREARADTLLERYKEAIAASPYDIENLADNVPNLYSLHNIYQLYHQAEPWYVLPFMPSSSIKNEVETAYFAELQAVLMPSLEKSIANDLFVYVNLEEQATTLSLLNSYRLLFDANKKNTEELDAYFVHSLEAQNSGSASTIMQLKVLLDDAFNRGLVPLNANSNLEQLAKGVINRSGIETLLYQHIQNLPLFTKRIDIRSELGSNFGQLYSFEPSYVGYLVPFLYTPNGFIELDLSVDSPLLKEALSAYSGVAGNAPSALELYRISRDLKQMYQNDYINYWKDFINNVSMKPVNDTTVLSQTVNLLSNASNNPLTNYYSVLSKYTNVTLPSETSAKKTSTPSSNASANSGNNADETQASSEINPALIEKQDKIESARMINANFSSYLDYVTPAKDSIKPIDTLLAKITKLKVWLDSFYQSENARKLAFDTLAKPMQSSNPIADLETNADQQPALAKQLVTSLTQLSNDSILSLAHEYLNKQWKSAVIQTYQTSIASYYPFDNNSKTDASIADVQAFFSSKGVFANFENQFLTPFLQPAEGSPYLPGFLPSSGLMISPEVWTMSTKADQIRSALFLAKPDIVSVNFQLKAVDMSASVTEFIIYNDQPLFTYQHGPSLWKSMSWEGEQQAEDTLNIELKNNVTSLARQNFSGNWNWFRLIHTKTVKTANQGAEISLGDSSNAVTLTIKTQGQVNPFAPNFFTDFKLPADL
ncbi:type VI secretion system membrane subunit TssM [Vibrio sp. ZSDZ65]|uniref:Type VI secretion system membrane subunit TssM n=1 Tax=Vibrio qingdaonensis TaxID=2829491 RepID=A0A9X3CJJ1_9VIBR|nr:type VI secretion system membrane subunit TssM [Vibrio qingdaonensis]MCW8344594.1 type VI secretion system membrane subunit TssM [Vibrio qingdaonensis]